MRDQLRSLEEDQWNDYKRVLRRQNQPIFDELWEDARRHADAIGMVNPRRPIEGVLLSVAIEQQRAIHDLQEELESVKDEVGVVAGRVESLERSGVDKPIGDQSDLIVAAEEMADLENDER